MNQREIKFRAWDKKKKRWVNFTAIEFKRGKVSLRDGFGNYLDGDFEIVEYTGLKDKNGKEIYGGDIVKIGYVFGENEEINGVIYWFDIMVNWCVKFHNESWNQISLGYYNRKNDAYEIKVIGNIYENPELLK